MTVQGRDASNFDSSVDFAGLGLFTHKVTEGTSIVHDQYGPRLNAARAYGVPVLGSYHVVRTPGSGGAGSLADQLRFWVAQMDARTPWWRDHPHFVLQVDAERWSYDNVQPATVLQFAALLAGSGLSAWAITYASRGEYGDALRGIATPLWNADYRASSGGAYPGDGWTATSSGAPAGWAPYSGQTPTLLQYTSTPYDKDAFRGELAELLALTAQNGEPMDTVISWNTGWMAQRYFEDADPIVVPANAAIGAPGFSIPNLPKQRAAAAADAAATAIAGLKAAIDAIASTGTSVDTTAVLARIDQATAAVTSVHDDLAATKADLATAHGEITQLRAALAKAAQDGAADLAVPQA